MGSDISMDEVLAVKSMLHATLEYVSKRFVIADDKELREIYAERVGQSAEGMPSPNVLRADGVITLSRYNADDVGYLVPTDLAGGNDPNWIARE